MKSIALLALAFAPLVFGCGSSSSNNDTLHSSDLQTSQLMAHFSAQSGDSNVKVFASLFAKNGKGDNTRVILDQGDSFTASVGGAAPVAMTVEDPSGDVTYTATLPLATDAEDITVALARSSGKTSAPNTVIHLPAAFTMTTTAASSIKHGNPVDIVVTPPPTTSLNFEAVGSCLSSSGSDNTNLTAPALDANGKGTIDTNQIKMTGTCSVDLFLDELGGGTADPAYDPSQDVQSEQRRAVTLTITQ